VSVQLYRHDHRYEYDRVAPAATFFVASNADVRGSANLYPKVVGSSLS
jgi:hypothetical protein